MDDYTDRDAARLLAGLAKYAEAFGKDCAENMTVKELADDLAETITADPRHTNENEENRDRIYDGLNQ